MSNRMTIDARGLSCPQPAMLTREAMGQLAEGRLEVLVDSGTARENVSRIAAKAGWTVSMEEQPGGGWRMMLTR